MGLIVVEFEAFVHFATRVTGETNQLDPVGNQITEQVHSRLQNDVM